MKLSREGSRQGGEANIESDFTALPRETAFSSVARTGTGNFLPESWFSWQKLFYWVIFLPMGPIPDLFQKYLAISFSSLCASVFWGCSWGDTLLLGDICRHVTDRNREPHWLPEVKLPANLCVSVFVDVLFLIFLWLSCDVSAVQITSPSLWYKFQLFTLQTTLLLTSQGWSWGISNGLAPDSGTWSKPIISQN